MKKKIKQMTVKNKILLHACCGICSSYPIFQLREMGYEPIVYFYNPNIYPIEEYNKRVEAEKTLCNSNNCELVIAKYEPDVYFEKVKGFEQEPEHGKRCDICFEIRLRKSAQYALKSGIDTFTTSIVISPHKNFKLISEIGFKIANDYGLKYLAIDFKKKDGFLKSNKIANSLKLYRQNYCGCKFSVRKEEKEWNAV